MRHPIMGPRISWTAGLPCFPPFWTPTSSLHYHLYLSSSYPWVVRLSSLRLFVESFPFFLFFRQLKLGHGLLSPKHFHVLRDRSRASLQGISFFPYFFSFFFSLFKVLILVVGLQFMQELSQWRSATSTALVQSSRVHVQRDGARQSLPGSSFEVAIWGRRGGKKRLEGSRQMVERR